MATYDFEYIVAGRNFGCRPWRDPADPDHIYHIRERNEVDFVSPQGFEGVKINVRTGVNTVLQFWDEDDDYGDLGACFANAADIDFNNSILTGFGTKLYISGGSSTAGPGTQQSVIIEFNKADFSVSQSFATGFFLDTGGIRVYKSNGVAVMHPAGTYYARGGDTDIGDLGFTKSFIELYRPSNDAYGHVDLAALGVGDFLGLHSRSTAPILFSDDGTLWFLTMPWIAGPGGGRPDRATGASTLYKATITELAGVLSLTIDDSYAVPDDFYAYAAGAGAVLSFAETFAYKRMVYDSALDKIYLWGAWYDSNADPDYHEGWFLEFTPASGTFTRGPLAWTAGKILNNSLGPYLDSAGYSLDNTLATFVRNAGVSTASFNFFDITAGTETQIPLESSFGFTGTLNNSALFHSTGSNVYAVDVDFATIDGGFQVYRDGLFSIDTPTPVARAYTRIFG